MQPHDFWQDVHPAGSFDRAGPFSGFFPATLDDGSQIRLPIRPLADGEHALASLIINQASFDVQDALAADLAPKIAAFRPEVIVGLPTLGLTLAAAVARALGHLRYVPLGTSRKFWYDESLSVPLSSITTPEQQKRLYADPRMLPLIKGRRVALIDDVISSGTSIVSGLTLMASLGIEPVVIGAAMLQSERWHDKLDAFGTEWRPRVTSVFRTPMLKKAGEGSWMP
ncbi:phosphoribosyltransferase [Neorhizobium galegae]|uniref:phosphoribosyltransferase n=1 Tax=Neorhizobium galegae TaxID=399 RepID=UPI00062243EB|nr:phosphoribosyltransferase [Neorhizobium galegae]KAB1124026.1 phosphoribosyltransferase [Neorhizobium galegae]MCQ1806635.1 phosphoribosyltransferase [Neorhizobium galegae]CDZ56420.1 PRPP-binding protein, adenine/guanine phosphoribosyltransferase [Neorhizobium galegae bv. orientalis]CDZ58842.1 PRPP-binding protein, adenine/guanine phosphoribosyltransferase [Neorhizobium galegae bv. orientalis]